MIPQEIAKAHTTEVITPTHHNGIHGGGRSRTRRTVRVRRYPAPRVPGASGVEEGRGKDDGRSAGAADGCCKSLSLTLSQLSDPFHTLLPHLPLPHRTAPQEGNSRLRYHPNSPLPLTRPNPRLTLVLQNRAQLNHTKDRQERAIYAFTIVTVIFLPLSAVASIFGMNSADVRDMSLGQWAYWATAVPATVVVVVLGLWFTGEFGNLARWVGGLLFAAVERGRLEGRVRRWREWSESDAGTVVGEGEYADVLRSSGEMERVRRVRRRRAW